MIGTVKVYQGYDDKPILEESNLIVDGFKEHIVDIMTRVPAPSALDDDVNVSASYNTSNFTVQAMSLAPNESNFNRINALGVASGLIRTSTVSGVNPMDDYAWSYREDFPNGPDFTGVNFRGNPAVNSRLSNGTFSSVTNFFKNNTFKDYSLDIALSGFYVNELLSLYELPNWTIQSDLRYNPSSSEFDDSYEYGSCARYDMSAALPDVSSIYSILSGTEASSTYAEPDDGILFIRSFAPSSTVGESSGAVVLKQTATAYNSSLEPWVSLSGGVPSNVLAEIKFQFSSLAGLDGAEIHVTARDVVEGDYYNFSESVDGVRNSWGGDGSALVVDASAGLSGTVSKFIQVPQSKVKNPLEVSFYFYSKTDSDNLKCYFWNAGLNIIDSWGIGNLSPQGDITTVSGNDFRSSGLYVNLSAVGSVIESTDLSNITYVSQFANLNPTKRYSYAFYIEPNTNTGGTDTLRGACVKRYASNVFDQGKYNLLTDLRASSLVETRLMDSTYAISPEYNRTATFTKYDALDVVKASDLCLEVSSSLSGGFSCASSNSFKFTGEILKSFYNGLSAAPVEFTLETSGFDVNGDRLKFNFESGNWVVSGEGTSLKSSSVFDSGRWSKFESTTINPVPLIAEGIQPNSEGKFDFILTVSATGTLPGFVKSLKMESLAIPASEEVMESFKFSTDGTDMSPSAHWVTVGDEIFSGIEPDKQAPRVFTNPGIGQISLIGTYALFGMFGASASIHESDSVYQFFILPNTANTGATNEFVKVEGVYCVDACLLVVDEEVSDDVLTSETYFRNPRRDILTGAYFVQNDSSSLYPTQFYSTGGLGFLNVAGIYQFTGSGLGLLYYGQNDPGAAALEPTFKMCKSFSLSDLTLPVSSEGVAFSIDYNSIAAEDSQYEARWSVVANTRNGDYVYWNATDSIWEKKGRGEETLNSFVYPVSGINTATLSYRFNRSTIVSIDNEDFTDDTVLTFNINLVDIDNAAYLFLNNWRFYNVTASATFDLGTFPEPDDTTVQPVNELAGRLGQFTNNLEYKASSITTDRALGSANWLPDVNVSALSSYPGSTHNAGKAINSDGFIYKNDTLLAGTFAISGYYTSSNSTSIVHVIDVSSTDCDFFDTQGGIGAIGLWGFDIDATYRKLLDNGYSLSAIYNTDGEDPADLYNMTEIDRNPVFRLLSKKVFRRPLTAATTVNPSVLRIVWEIKFL